MRRFRYTNAADDNYFSVQLLPRQKRYIVKTLVSKIWKVYQNTCIRIYGKVFSFSDHPRFLGYFSSFDELNAEKKQSLFRKNDCFSCILVQIMRFLADFGLIFWSPLDYGCSPEPRQDARWALCTASRKHNSNRFRGRTRWTKDRRRVRRKFRSEGLFS